MDQNPGSLSLESGDPERKRCVKSNKVTKTSVIEHAVGVLSRQMKAKRIVSVVLLAQQRFLRNNSTSVVGRLQKAKSVIIRHEQQLYFGRKTETGFPVFVSLF